MSVTLAFQPTGTFGGVSFNYGFSYDNVAGTYYVAHTALNASGVIVNPSTDETLQAAVTALQAIEASVQGSSLTELQAIATALSAKSTASGQAASLAVLEAIQTLLATSSTAAGQASALTSLQAIASSTAAGPTSAGQATSIAVLETIASELSRNLTFSDKSGTCSTVNAFVTEIAANTGRGYLRVSNPNATGTLYVYDKVGGTPSLTNSFSIAPGVSRVWEHRVPNGAIFIAGSVASLAFEAAEGV